MKQLVRLIYTILGMVVIAGTISAVIAYNIQPKVTLEAVEAARPIEPVTIEDIAPTIDIGQVFTLVNDERIKSGLQPLVRDQQLDAAAQDKCDDMVAKDYWAHDAPNGTEPWHFIDETEVRYRMAGENLAYGFKKTEGIVPKWMNSPGHKANILKPEFTNVGYAQCRYNAGSKQGIQSLLVQMFTLPR